MRKVTVSGLLARKLRLALTALAIVLGVTFVTGTLVLGDTLNRTFDRLIGDVYGHVSFQIRGRAVLGNSTAAAINGTAFRRRIPDAIAVAVRRLPGVADAYGALSGYAQFVARDGSAIGNGGRAALGFSFDPNPQLSAVRLVAGRPPSGPHDVVMDRRTATRDHFAVGQTVRVLLPGPPRPFTITGIVTFCGADTLVGTTLAGFDRATAQRLFHAAGGDDTIEVLAARGANTVALQRAIARILPPGLEVVSGQTLVSQLSTAVNDELSFISTALLIFACIALAVGAFTIFNTFSITVGQRTRELALLRLVGASRRQVFGSVLAEAALTGLLASLAGLGLGVAAALGLKALLGAFGIALPSAPLVFSARTPLVAIAVGVGVTVLAALVPARAAVRIPPVAALAEHGERTAAGRLARVLVRPLVAVLGRPLAAMLGPPGRLGRENAMRNPRRTARTAAALTVGLALVSTIAVLGASLSASARHSIETTINADEIVTGSGGNFSAAVPRVVSAAPGAATTTTVYRGQFAFEGALSTLTAATPAGLLQTIRLHVTAGRGPAAMAAGELLVDSPTARADHLHVGSPVPVTFAQTGPATLRVGGIFERNPLVGRYVAGDATFRAHFHDPLPAGVLVRAAPGAHDLTAALTRALAPYANVTVQTRAQFESAQQAQVNQLLGLVYVLLALAVAVAVIGIVNTLMLSVLERTHEIGLLRAVGMRRRQVRAMIRSEAVIIAVFGALVGIAFGTAAGVAIAGALRSSGVTVTTVPVGSLVAFLVLAAVLGLAAATWPARRAAHLNVLAAIAVE